MAMSLFICYGQEIHRNPYKKLYETENGITFSERVNFSDQTRIEMEKQLERAHSEEEKKMIKEMFKDLISEDERMKTERLFFVSVPAYETDGYSNITFSATKEKMENLLKVLCTGDFNNGDYVNHNKVVFTYSEKDDMFIVSETEYGITSTGFVHRKDFKEMYAKMKDLQEKSVSD
jgi:hypothetical protein